jgi:hypothetical protein
MTDEPDRGWRRWFSSGDAKWSPIFFIALPAAFLVIALNPAHRAGHTVSKGALVGVAFVAGALIVAAAAYFLLNLRAGIGASPDGVAISTC